MSNIAQTIKQRLQEVASKAGQAISDLTATTEVSEQRMEICRGCPRLFAPTTTCKECGCFMIAKTKLKTAECPLGKW